MHLTVLSPQDIGAVAKAWEDSPYLFIVKMQPLFRGLDEDELGTEQLSFAFTSKNRLSTPHLHDTHTHSFRHGSK